MARTRSAILFGFVAASFAFLGGCSQEDYYCDESGCYYCDGLGCRPAEPPDRTECGCNADCASGLECTSLGCTQVCDADSDCARGTVCDGGYCVQPTETAPTASLECTCTLNSDCDRFETGGEDLVCIDGSCVPTETPTCDATNPCPAGRICVAGECRVPDDVCHFSSECGPGRICVNQECTTGCDATTPCPAGAQCIDGFCREEAGPECTVSTDCPTGDVCVDGACWDRCTSDAQCGEGRYCGTDGRCRVDSRPRPICSRDSDCAEGAVCRDGVCRSPCDDATDCRRFDEQLTFCVDMLCYTTNEATSDCEAAAECMSGQDCVDGICR